MLVDLLRAGRQLGTLWLSLYRVIDDGDSLIPRFLSAWMICIGLIVGSFNASRKSLPSSAESLAVMSSIFDAPLSSWAFIS